MSQNPIQVEVRGKQIIKEPINKLIVQGELEGETIVFTLERYVGGKDLLEDGVTFEMNGVNSNGQSAVNILTKGTTSNPNRFTLTWVVGQQFTAANYEMRIWISAVKSVNNQVVFRWSTYPARIYIHEGFILSDYVSVTDQLLLDLGSYLSQAQASAAAAGNSAQQAKTSETNAKVSETNAKASETAAASSASKAAASESNAKTSETNAKASETAAKASQTAAKTSEINAANSASAAKSSQDAAKTSETNAKASETAAAKSEANAADSASTAARKADDARQSAIESADSATEALISQQQAKNSADNSRDSAAAALDSERNAKQSEEAILANIDRAETSASLANQSANDAEDAARRAKDSENQAVQSAAESEGSAIDARNSADSAYQTIQDAIATFGNDVLLQMLIMRDPTTGNYDTAQNIVNNLFRQLADGSITPEEFDYLQITPEVFDAMQIDPFEFDTNAKYILTDDVGSNIPGTVYELAQKVQSLVERMEILESRRYYTGARLTLKSSPIAISFDGYTVAWATGLIFTANTPLGQKEITVLPGSLDYFSPREICVDYSRLPENGGTIPADEFFVIQLETPTIEQVSVFSVGQMYTNYNVRKVELVGFGDLTFTLSDSQIRAIIDADPDNHEFDEYIYDHPERF